DLCGCQGPERQGGQLAFRNGPSECAPAHGLAQGFDSGRHSCGDSGLSRQKRRARCQRQASQAAGRSGTIFWWFGPDTSRRSRVETVEGSGKLIANKKAQNSQNNFVFLVPSCGFSI